MPFSNELQRATELIQGYSRALGLTDAIAGVDRLSESLQPVFDIWGTPEHAALRGELLCWGAAIAAAGGAGVRSQGILFNAATSGKLMVLEHANTSVTAPTLAFVTSVAGYTIQTSVGVRDSRLSTGRIGELYAKTTGAFSGAYRGNARNSEWDRPIVIAPGTGVSLDPSADNTAITVTFVWRERRMLPGEFPNQLQ